MWRGRRLPDPRGWLASLLAPAADPRQTVAGPPRQPLPLAEVTAARDQLTALQRRLAARAGALQATIAGLAEQAVADLAAGDEARARQALLLRELARRQRRALADQTAALAEEERRLDLLAQRLTLQHDALRTRQDLAAARADLATTQARLAAALAGLTTELTDLTAGLARAERQTDQTRAWAAALDDLATLAVLTEPGQPPGDTLAADLDRLELEQAVEAHLAALRQAATHPLDPAGEGDG